MFQEFHRLPALKFFSQYPTPFSLTLPENWETMESGHWKFEEPSSKKDLCLMF